MQINNGQPLSAFMKSLKHERLLNFTRLSPADLSKIGPFLNSIWGQLYGKTGSPVFHQDYLDWMYGGPNKDKNILLGSFVDNELVAFQSFLYRRMVCNGNALDSYLNTHLAVSPRLDLRHRMDALMQLTEQMHLFHPDSDYYIQNSGATFAFIEEGKPLKSVGDKLAAKYFQIKRKTFTSFNQCVIMPARLKKFLNDNPPPDGSACVRAASEADTGQLAALFNQTPDSPHFMLTMTEEQLRHYCFGHPAHGTFVIDRDGKIEAFINFYPLETVKDGKTQFFIVIDFLITPSSDGCGKPQIATLLLEAVKYAERMNAKGVVFENATYLNFEEYVPLGLVPSFRKMNLVVLTGNESLDYSGNFRCDVK